MAFSDLIRGATENFTTKIETKKFVTEAGQSNLIGFTPQKAPTVQTAVAQEAPTQQVGLEAGQVPPIAPTVAPQVAGPVGAVAAQEAPVAEEVGITAEQIPVAVDQTRSLAEQQGELQGQLANVINTDFSSFLTEKFATLAPLEQQFLQQAMTGETESTRAFRAKEASAMSDAITNMNNQISTTASASGITGQALVQLRAQANDKVADMMGDFALNNLINMANTKQEGLSNLMATWGFQQNSITNVLNNIQFANQIVNTQKQTDFNTLNQIMSIAGENPLAGRFILEWTDFSASNPGATIESFLGTEGKEGFKGIIADAEVDSYNIQDIIRTKSSFDLLGIETAFVQKVDDNGNPLETAEGQPVLQVVPKSQLTRFADGVFGIEFISSTEPVEEVKPPPSPILDPTTTVILSGGGGFQTLRDVHGNIWKHNVETGENTLVSEGEEGFVQTFLPGQEPEPTTTIPATTTGGIGILPEEFRSKNPQPVFNI